MLSKVVNNISYCDLNNRNILREVMMKIGLERIDTQEGVTVKVLLDSGAVGLVMSSEFVRKQGSELKKIERLIYIRNINGFFNKERLIEYMVEVYLLLEIQEENRD